MVIDAAGQTLGTLAEVATDILTLGMGAEAMAGGASNPQLQALARMEAEERASVALDNIADSVRRGAGIQYEDIRNLTGEQLGNLRDTGDAGLLTMIKMHEEDAQRSRDQTFGLSL